jgi:predicted metal-dependent hydrolase
LRHESMLLMREPRNIKVNGIGQVLFEPSFRARRIIISVQPHKGVRVALPGRASVNSALEFVRKKKPWILKQLAKIAESEIKNKALANSFAAMDGAETRRKMTARIYYLAMKHGFSFNRVFIRNQQTRWGSCSHKNNISLNAKLVVLPQKLSDYVILHELVHTRIHDHSRRFWTELDKYVGNGKAIAKQLRNYDTRWI